MVAYLNSTVYYKLISMFSIDVIKVLDYVMALTNILQVSVLPYNIRGKEITVVSAVLSDGALSSIQHSLQYKKDRHWHSILFICSRRTAGNSRK